MKPGVAKSKGRATENSLVAYLRSWGLKVERRRLTGVLDQGDIAGWNTDKGSVCVEVKSAAEWRIGTWISELDVEAENAGAETGFIAARPKGKPFPEDWVAIIRLPWLLDLMLEAGYIPKEPALVTRGAEVLEQALEQLRTDAQTKRLANGYVTRDAREWQLP